MAGSARTRSRAASRAPHAWSLVFIPLVCALSSRAQETSALGLPRETSSVDRVIFTFDFDERPQGNTEDVPMFWVPMRRPDFPHYASGSFDTQVGHQAPPSFHLSCEGRSVAFIYSGDATRVRTNSEYRVEGFIRPDRLVHARACLSAHWIDKDGRNLADSLVRSRFVGGPGEPDDWMRVELRLPPAPPGAHTLGLAAWVLQEAQWNPDAAEMRRILHTDVHAGAWFDDLRVVRLPRIELGTATKGNVLSPRSPQALQVLLADPDDSGLRGQLTITDADERPVATHPVRVLLDAFAEPAAIPVPDLGPGLYHANFDVFAGESPIAHEVLTFAILAPLGERTESAARSFGVSLDVASVREPMAEAALLKAELVRSAKIPTWTGEYGPRAGADSQAVVAGSLRELTQSGFALTAVLAAAPSELARRHAAGADSLLDLINADPKVWEPSFARVVASCSDSFAWWQVGADESPIAEWNTKARQAVVAVRSMLKRFQPLPQISISLSARDFRSHAEINTDAISFDPFEQTEARELERQMRERTEESGKRWTAFVAPLDDRYQRLPRIADWARRVLTARHAGFDTVFVPQTWSVRPTPRGPMAEPLETFILLRTIASVVGDAAPGPRLTPAPGVDCLTFRSGDTATYAIWDLDAPPEGRVHSLPVGSAARQFDLWGVAQPITEDAEGRRRVRLSSLPTLIVGVPTWFADLQTAFTLAPDHIEAGRSSADLLLEAKYVGPRSLMAHAVLSTPAGWEIYPREFDMHLSPSRVTQVPFSAHFPSGEPAGGKSLRLSLLLEDGISRMELPLTTQIALADVDVSGVAIVQGERLVLQHVVTNRSGTPLNFRAVASVPGRERQHRPITELRPGETQTVEYRFPAGRELIGRSVRLSLQETNDGPRSHVLELRVP